MVMITVICVVFGSVFICKIFTFRFVWFDFVTKASVAFIYGCCYL